MGEFNVSASTPTYTNNTNPSTPILNNTNPPVISTETNPTINTTSVANIRFDLNTVNPEKTLILNFPTFENRNNNDQRMIPLDDNKFREPTLKQRVTDKIDSLSP